MDRRLATIIQRGFDDCNCLASAVKVQVFLWLSRSCPGAWGSLAQALETGSSHGAPTHGSAQGVSPGHSSAALDHICQCLFLLQLVHMFASLLERPLIKAEVSSCYSALLRMFKAELKNVKLLYDAQIASPLPAINKNMPLVAGQLKWALELQQRLEGLHKDLFAIDHPYVWVSLSLCGDAGQDLAQCGPPPVPHCSSCLLTV